MSDDQKTLASAKTKPRRRSKSHPGSITKRGDAWRLRLCVNGEYHSFTVHGTKVDAQNFATTKHAELTGDVTRIKQGLPGRVTFSQLLDEYIKYAIPTRAAGTQKSYKDSCANFRAYFVDRLSDPSLRDVRRHHCMTYLEWRRTKNENRTAGGHTIARDRRVLLRLFNYAMEKEYVDANPAKFAKAAKPDPRTPPILSSEQLEALLTAAAPNRPLWFYILLLAETGMRAYSEALALEWSDVDVVTGTITIRSTPTARNKSGKTRVVPITKRLVKAAKDHAAQFQLAHRSAYVFTHERTLRAAKEGERVLSFRDSFAAAARTAELPTGFRPHDLRHRRVTTWLGNKKAAQLVQAAMGHASIATTMGYSHLTAAHLRSLVDDTPEAAPASGQEAATSASA